MIGRGTWEYARASDRPLGEVPAAFADRVSDLQTIPTGAVFLLSDEQRLEIWWRDELAVVGHCDSEEGDLDCAVTEQSLDQSDSIPASDLIEWSCSCCGVLLGRFTRAVHIRRDTALEIFQHVIVHRRRPDRSIDGPIIWSVVDAE